MTGLPDEFDRVDLDGLATRVGALPGPVRAVLAFRVGQADETLAQRGRTHLLEHLALTPSGPADPVQGEVDLLDTTFGVEGSAPEVAERLVRIASLLGDPPADRLETERRILAVEDEARGASTLAVLLGLHYGARGPGLANWDELGLRDAGVAELRAHAAHWFTRGNATLVLSAPVPGLEGLPLPPGERRSPPQAVPLAYATLPAEVTGLGLPVALGAPVRDAAAAGLLADLLERRVWDDLRVRRGLAYHVDGRARHVGDEQRLLSLITDVAEQDAGAAGRLLLETLGDLAAERFDERELADVRAGANRRITSAEPFGLTVAAALADLVGGRPRSLAERVAELEEPGPGDVAALAREARDALVLTLPDGAATGALPTLDRRGDGPVDGLRHARRRLPRRTAAVDVVVGDAGVSALLDAGGGHVTVRYDRCAAAVRDADGGLALIGEDGDTVILDPGDLRDGAAAVRRVLTSIDPARVVGPDERARRVAGAARGGLRPLMVGEATELAAARVGRNEAVVLACEAQRGVRAGILVVTSQRLLFVAKLLAEHAEEVPLGAITALHVQRNPLAPALVVRHGGGRTRFSFMTIGRARTARDAVHRAVTDARVG